MLPALADIADIVRQTSLTDLELDILRYPLPQILVLADTLYSLVVRAELYDVAAGYSGKYVSQVPSKRKLSILIERVIRMPVRTRVVALTTGLAPSPVVNLPY
jgi:hypothetical protein